MINILLNPKLTNRVYQDDETKELLEKTIQFFENKGKVKLKEDFHERAWYRDFLDFQKEIQLFYKFLTPSEYGEEGCRWDTYRNCQLNEILGFYGLGYWYTWQVSILGLGPIWQSKNEKLKKETAKFLKDGEIFGFGLSEKEHGADIYSTSMKLIPQADGNYKGNGEKYYIGNGNEGAFLSTFARITDKDGNIEEVKDKSNYTFFVVNSQHENYECIKNVCSSQNYVSNYALNDYPITEEDILSKGQAAWDACLNTINIGKFNLGWASIGICTHALYESLNHAAHRNLFDHYVTDFTHIKQLFMDSYIRLLSMKLFGLRGIDYMRSASKDDRRYLLYNPMVKMKVTTEGEKMMEQLFDIIAAKGFESDTYFEEAIQSIKALPKLEGTVHVNMALVIKFMPNFFGMMAPYKEFSEIPKRDDIGNDDFMFDQGETRGLSKIQFDDFSKAYELYDTPNVNIFKSQIEAMREFMTKATPNMKQADDFDFLLKSGEIFSNVVYGKLILENAKKYDLEDDLVDQIFDVIIRDFSQSSLGLFASPTASKKQEEFFMKMLMKPTKDKKRFQRVLEKYVYSLIDKYEMTP